MILAGLVPAGNDIARGASLHNFLSSSCSNCSEYTGAHRRSRRKKLVMRAAPSSLGRPVVCPLCNRCSPRSISRFFCAAAKRILALAPQEISSLIAGARRAMRRSRRTVPSHTPIRLANALWEIPSCSTSLRRSPRVTSGRESHCAFSRPVLWASSPSGGLMHSALLPIAFATGDCGCWRLLASIFGSAGARWRGPIGGVAV